MIDASETVVTFKVNTNSGMIVSVFPPKNKDTINKYPVCEKTPNKNRNKTNPATLANMVVTTTNAKQPARKITLPENQGTSPKNKYHPINTLGSNLAITVSSFPYAFFNT